MLKERLPVAVLGATGIVGQRFLQLLDNHPWFRVTHLTGTQRSAGKTFSEACHWLLERPMPEWAASMTVLPSLPPPDVQVAFSALPARDAREIEAEYARSGISVCSNASAYRTEDDVPIILPEVNPDHAALIEAQRRLRGWTGSIVCNSNCTITGATIALHALRQAFGVQRVFMVSLQAVSGAGYPGVASLDILGNVIPYVDGEEEKMESEPLKIMGHLQRERIEPAPIAVSAHAHRVPVIEGHMVVLSVELGEDASMAEIGAALADFRVPQICAGLPASLKAPILVRSEPDRPQPRLDALAGRGMATIVGRLRPDPQWSLRMVTLSHNTIRGAAGGSVYNAELLHQQGWI